jgi:hypothetical protein
MAKEPELFGPPRPPRLRIRQITLDDFRAFGSGPTSISFGREVNPDCNLLLYGENGAGKSSLFEALRGLFARKPELSLFRRERNVFSSAPEADAKVEVDFNDGLPPAAWTVAHHPGRGGTADQRIVQTAMRSAMLDYRALLDTNYGQGSGEPNLFTIALDHLLRDYPLVGGSTLGAAWDAIESSRPWSRWSSRDPVDAACATFNNEFSAAITALLPFTREILKDLLGDALTLDNLVHGSVRYVDAHQRRDRLVDGRLLTPVVRYRSHALQRPQYFLNEARQSALALAIYLGSRLACTQRVPLTAPKLLVLDDVLIGLDQSNRLPVLDVLMRHFHEWQIILLTHDRLWFDMARERLEPKSHWAYLELHDASGGAAQAIPVARSLAPSAPEQALDQAQTFLTDGYIAAAANYARTAFELELRQWAERWSVKLRFRQNTRELQPQEIMNAIGDHAKAKGPKSEAAKALREIELYRKVILNPLSHAGPPGVERSEVQGAITAVRFMAAVAKAK